MRHLMLIILLFNFTRKTFIINIPALGTGTYWVRLYPSTFIYCTVLFFIFSR